MRCESVRELFDDHEKGRLSGALEADVAGHLDGCPACARALESHRVVVRSLEALTLPPLPVDFESRLADRLARVEGSGSGSFAAWLRDFVPDLVRYVAGGVAGVALAVVFLGSPARQYDPTAEGIAFNGVAPLESTYPPVVAAAEPASRRFCDPATDALEVEEDDDVNVTLTVQTGEPVEGAKFHVVLPKGLAFSPDDYPDMEGKQVLTILDDMPDGTKDLDFTVRGVQAGKWEVTAIVEAGDDVLVSGTTILVAPREERL